MQRNETRFSDVLFYFPFKGENLGWGSYQYTHQSLLLFFSVRPWLNHPPWVRQLIRGKEHPSSHEYLNSVHFVTCAAERIEYNQGYKEEGKKKMPKKNNPKNRTGKYLTESSICTDTVTLNTNWIPMRLTQCAFRSHHVVMGKLHSVNVRKEKEQKPSQLIEDFNCSVYFGDLH